MVNNSRYEEFLMVLIVNAEKRTVQGKYCNTNKEMSMVKRAGNVGYSHFHGPDSGSCFPRTLTYHKGGTQKTALTAIHVTLKRSTRLPADAG